MDGRATLPLAFVTFVICAGLPVLAAAQHQGASSAPDPMSSIYRYQARDGRTVYTNVLEQVPLAQRADAEVDLSRISLNSELGTELERSLKQAHARLSAGEYCEGLRAEADAPWESMWRDEAPLVICGAALLLFLLITPTMLRKFGAAIWMRTLMTAASWLTIAGLTMFGSMRAARTASSLKDQLKPCETSTWDALAKQDKGLSKHVDLVRDLQMQSETQAAALERIHRESQ